MRHTSGAFMADMRLPSFSVCAVSVFTVQMLRRGFSLGSVVVCSLSTSNEFCVPSTSMSRRNEKKWLWFTPISLLAIMRP